MNWKKTLLICLIILMVAGAVTSIVFLTEPTAQRTGASRETAMLVDVITVHRGTFTPTVEATGTVEPAQEVNLSSRVNGEIIDRSRAFIPGGYVNKGEMLLQIDPADYKNTLQQRKSDLRQAIADLNIEKGRQDVARQDYQLVRDTLIDTLSQSNEALVLREPQLESVRASVESAQASVNQAELDLQRTTIRAPFDAHIITRNVNVGSQVATGENLGRLVGRKEYWVNATIPLSKVNWLTFPGGEGERGSKVSIRNRTAWPEGQYRTGYLHKQIGALEDQTRMARVLVSVPDPLAYNKDSADTPPLMIGSFVQVNMQARELADVIRLNRDNLRQEETVWVMEDGKLDIRDVDILFQDSEYAYIRSGLEENDQVVTSNLSTVVEGSRLRLEENDTTSGQDAVRK